MGRNDDRSPSMVDRLVERIGASPLVSHVAGEPVERDGLTVVPVASVRFGGGGGGGGDDDGSGEGGGFGVVARPAGAFVISDAGVQWRPAVDATRLILAANATVVAALAFAWLRARSRARAAARAAG